MVPEGCGYANRLSKVQVPVLGQAPASHESGTAAERSSCPGSVTRDQLNCHLGSRASTVGLDLIREVDELVETMDSSSGDLQV